MVVCCSIAWVSRSETIWANLVGRFTFLCCNPVPGWTVVWRGIAATWRSLAATVAGSEGGRRPGRILGDRRRTWRWLVFRPERCTSNRLLRWGLIGWDLELAERSRILGLGYRFRFRTCWSDNKLLFFFFQSTRTIRNDRNFELQRHKEITTKK